MRWSPEQISGWLSEQGIKLSHERIYQMIWDDKRDGGIEAAASISFAAEDFRRILYSATALQTADEALKGHTLLATAFRECFKVRGVFSQSGTYGFINHI